MSQVTSLRHHYEVWAGYYTGKTIKCALLDGASIAISQANYFMSALADDDYGVTHATCSGPAITIDTDANPDRVEMYIGDVTFTNVAAVTKSFTGTAPSSTFNSTGHTLQNADRVLVVVSSGLAGVTNGMNYYIVNRTADTFQLSLTKGGTPISYTTSGSGTATKQIQSVAYYVSTGNLATSAIIFHGDLASPLTPNGTNIKIQASADGLVQGAISVTS